MNAAIFDIDRTLLDGMSGYLFAAHLWRTGAMPIAGRLRSLRAMLLYRLGLADKMIIVESGVVCYAGLTTAQVRDLAERAVRERMLGRLYVEALDKVREHAAAGDRVLLATGSSVFIAEALAGMIGAHAGIGTDSLRDGDRLLPVMAEPPCVAEGKRDLALRWLAAAGIAADDTVLYTDNGIDIPLAEVVGKVVAVNPDVELTRYARERELPVERWMTPQDPNHRRTGTSWPLRG
ncbi:MAG: HAD family hydrolase [Alphaproteobacteria bacterium]